MITIGIPTLKRYDTLVKLIESAEQGSVVPDYYMIIDNGGSLQESHVLDTYGSKIDIHIPGRNLGVAASWNILLAAQRDIMLICNDDVTFQIDTLKHITQYAVHNPNEGFVHGQSTTGDNAWSFFVQRHWLFDLVGPYDEHLWPAYFEDNDYCYRMALARYFPCMVPGCVYEHVGSATLKAYTPDELNLHHERFRANQEYYTSKWGGGPHYETFLTPFDL